MKTKKEKEKERKKATFTGTEHTYILSTWRESKMYFPDAQCAPRPAGAPGGRTNISQSSEAPQLRPDGRVAAHPLLGSRARLAHTQALTLLQLLRVLLERVAEGPEGLALRVELDLDLLTRGGGLDAPLGLQPTAHRDEGGSRARPARAARPPRRAPARPRRSPRRSRAACARRSAPGGVKMVFHSARGGDGGVQVLTTG